MVNIALMWGLKALGIGKQIARWEGFRSWKFWAGLGAALALGWVLLTNMNLHKKNTELVLDAQVQEQKYEKVLDKNDELLKTLRRVEAGGQIDQAIIISNEQANQRLREQHEQREDQIEQQVSSGSAGNATICAITGVCNN